MPSISSPGLGSGLDVASLVNQLVALERRPLQKMQAAVTDMKTQLSSMGKIQSYLATLRDAASALRSPSTWGQVAATSSQTSVGVSASAGAPTGQYTVAVQALAKAQNVASATPYASASSPVGAGSLTFTLGQYSLDTATPPQVNGFTPQAGATPVTVTIAPENSTLTGIRDQINAAGAGVTASIVNDASGARLLIRSNETGAAQGFRIEATESGGAGLGALAFDAQNANTPMLQVQAAQNAVAQVNGLTVTSSTNRLTGAIEGLTLDLNTITNGPVLVNVSRDDAGLQSRIQAFADAYNTLSTYLSEQTRYDDASKTAGPLQGDSTILGILSEMRRLVGSPGTASATFSRLSDIGLELQRNGTLSTNTSKLNDALKKPTELQAFFSATGTGDAQGWGLRFAALADRHTNSTGTLTLRSQSLNQRIANNNKDQAKFEDRVELYRARLTAQYTALDQTMARINGTSGYVNNFLNSLNRTA